VDYVDNIFASKNTEVNKADEDKYEARNIACKSRTFSITREYLDPLHQRSQISVVTMPITFGFVLPFLIGVPILTIVALSLRLSDRIKNIISQIS